jgi:twitching motility two-component system response regulator PilH
MGTVPVVDDIAGNARLLESLLAPNGHTVRTAGDGAEALRLVRSEHPDLVLMDVMMPSVDRFEACRAGRARAIKQDPSTRLIPVVVTTSGSTAAATRTACAMMRYRCVRRSWGSVDVFDALTTERPYKAALPFARAAEELRGEAARGWGAAPIWSPRFSTRSSVAR